MQRHKTNNGVFFFKEILFFFILDLTLNLLLLELWHTTHDNDTVRRAADQNDTLFREESGVDGAVAVCVGREAVLLLLLPRLVVPGQHRSRSSTSDTNAWLFATSAFTYCVCLCSGPSVQRKCIRKDYWRLAWAVAFVSSRGRAGIERLPIVIVE